MFIHPVKIRLIVLMTLTLAGVGLSGCDYWPPALHHELEQLRADLNDALDERQRLDNDNAELRTQQASLQREVEEQHRENEELRNRLETLTTQHAQIVASQRVTGPSKKSPPKRTLVKGTYQQLRLTHPPMKGPKVVKLQRLLRKQGFRIRVDGVFGRDTAAAIQGFQRHHGLVADGSVGPKTEKVLRRSTKKMGKLSRQLR